MPITQGEYSTMDEEYYRSWFVGVLGREDFDGYLEVVIFDGTRYRSFCDFYVVVVVVRRLVFAAAVAIGVVGAGSC